jgi:tRNA A37 threonylcarbamoyltransferase TsaD
VAIDFAKGLGINYGVPVIPVSALESMIMGARRLAVLEQSKMDHVEFPFLSVLVTDKRTELVLTRGVGLHTLLGVNNTESCGSIFERGARLLDDFCRDKFSLSFD